jgi:hypothetical protein
MCKRAQVATIGRYPTDICSWGAPIRISLRKQHMLIAALPIATPLKWSAKPIGSTAFRNDDALAVLTGS